jgi:uncharacterized membrane protein YraQ (UPF0718 family)
MRAAAAPPSRRTALAFMIAVIGLTLPETVTLHKVLRARLIAAFIGVSGFGILLAEYAFNALQ